jgi:glycosyltransferase involved in cell wall biosynthesis
MSKGSLKIIFAIKSMNNPGGGAERVLADVTGELAKRGHQITLLTCDQPDGKSYYELNPGIKRVDLGIGFISKPSTPTITLRRILNMMTTVRRLSPDLAIGFMHSIYIPMGLALIFRGIPQIASEHTVYSHYSDKHLQRFLLKLTPLLTKRITCVSQQALDTYPTRMRKHMVVINNPLTLKTGIKADVAAVTKKTKTLLSVGRLDPEKNHAILINAFALISTRVPEWQLRIVGEGELYGDLTYQIDSLRLKERIHLVGEVKDIAVEYASAQLFVMPSRYESLGLTTIEAQAHGLPVVGFSDCPGTNRVIQDGINGLLVPAGVDRVLALASILEKLMLDNTARLNLVTPIQELSKKYQLKYVADQWEALINQIVKSS